MAQSTVTGPWKSENGFIGNSLDANGNEIIIETGVASAVNEVTVTNAATGNAPSIAASGETNVGLNLSSKGTGTVTIWTGALGREALILPNVASAVNEVTITQAATGNAPLIAASGETNVGLGLSSKGTGSVILWTGAAAREALILPNVASAVNEVTITQAATGNAPSIVASGETNVGLDVSAKGTGSVTLWTGGLAREALILPNVASAVNEVTITQAITAVAPTIAPSGGDTNIGLNLVAKGTAQVINGGSLVRKTTVTTDATAGAITYTAAQMLGGLILRDTAGANRADLTPTAALLVAAVPGAAVGSSFEFTIRQTSGGAETITLTAGSGATVSGTATIGQNNSKRWLAVFTNVTAASEAVTFYSLGTVVT